MPDALADLSRLTDSYFLRTKTIVGKFGDCRATYAIFMRRPVIAAPRLIVEFLEAMARARRTKFEIELLCREGDWVGAGEPMIYLSGSLYHLVDLETVYLQKLGPPCVAAYNAHAMCVDLPKTAFLAMDARHCAGTEMAEQMAYAASVGSAAAKRGAGAVGFIANATDETARWFGNDRGRGTMPHALIGYAGSTLRAAEMFRATFPDEPLTVLIDYFGREITDALEVARAFPDLAAAGQLSLATTRMAAATSKASTSTVPTKCWPGRRRNRFAAIDRRPICAIWSAPASAPPRSGICVSRSTAPAIPTVKIVASSGFSPTKCHMMAAANAPIDVIGTGSYLPENWTETYATADIVAYDDKPMVKKGREFLLEPRAGTVR